MLFPVPGQNLPRVLRAQRASFVPIGAALGVGPAFWVLAAALLAGSYSVRRQWRRRKA